MIQKFKILSKNFDFFFSNYHSVIHHNSKRPCYPLHYAKAVSTEYCSSPTLKFGTLIWERQVVPVCHLFLIKQQLQQNSHQVFLLLFQLIELFKAVDNWAHHGFICFSFPVLERLTKWIQLAIKSLRAETTTWNIARTKGSIYIFKCFICKATPRYILTLMTFITCFPFRYSEEIMYA